MSHKIRFTLRPGDSVLVTVEGREGSVFVGHPEIGSPFVTVNLTDHPDYSDSYLLTTPKEINRIGELPSMASGTLTLPSPKGEEKSPNPSGCLERGIQDRHIGPPLRRDGEVQQK